MQIKINKKINTRQDEIAYNNQPMLDLSLDEIQEVSELYSTSYGKYSKESPRRPGEPILLRPKYYIDNCCKPDIYIATARRENKLIGHAIYIRKRYDGYGIMTWVLQLVVDKACRKNGIAGTLLRSIWGFSDDYAWGLASANPCTVRTLESATFRKCKPKIIGSKLNAIRLIGHDTAFVSEDAYVISNQTSQVNSKFFVDNSEYAFDEDCEKRLGKLKPGHEWLAFTFQSQGVQKNMFAKHYDAMLEFSEKKLKDAYNRMQIETHKWAQGTKEEIDFITRYITDGTILDLGCGQGRHAIELSKRGFNVTGVDFSDKHIEYANSEKDKTNMTSETCNFLCADIRNLKLQMKYNHVICLYDVIGSFPDKKNNTEIIKTAKRNMKKGGYLILSVMNMELTESIVPESQKADLKRNPDILLQLPPSNTMQNSGNIFRPEYLAIDTKTSLVYRKEQFDNNNSLSAEYVIRDKRYYKDEIIELIVQNGFELIESRYVNSGHFNQNYEATDMRAKEILIVAKKK